MQVSIATLVLFLSSNKVLLKLWDKLTDALRQLI